MMTMITMIPGLTWSSAGSARYFSLNFLCSARVSFCQGVRSVQAASPILLASSSCLRATFCRGVRTRAAPVSRSRSRRWETRALRSLPDIQGSGAGGSIVFSCSVSLLMRISAMSF